MKVVIKRPKQVSIEEMSGLINLLKIGEQLNGNDKQITNGLKRAELVAFALDNNKIVSMAALKNPLHSYKNRIFREGNVVEEAAKYSKEVGYIVTSPSHEGNKLCQRILHDLLPFFEDVGVFATTRKKSMAHILSKFGFKPIGQVYKDDLQIFVRRFPIF